MTDKHSRDFHRLFLLWLNHRFLLHFLDVFHDTQWLFRSHTVTCNQYRDKHKVVLLLAVHGFLLQFSIAFYDSQWLFESHLVKTVPRLRQAFPSSVRLPFLMVRFKSFPRNSGRIWKSPSEWKSLLRLTKSLPFPAWSSIFFSANC